MAVEVATTRRRFTRAEYYRMAEAGILGEDDRVELIEGEIVQMSPIGDRHVAFVINVNNLLAGRLAGRALVSPQNPVVLTDDTVPQPDITVLRRRAYKERRVQADDVLLLIEVADSDPTTAVQMAVSITPSRMPNVRIHVRAGERTRARPSGGMRCYAGTRTRSCRNSGARSAPFGQTIVCSSGCSLTH